MDGKNFQGKSVSLYEAIKTAAFRKSLEHSEIVIPLGMDIDGNPEVIDLTKKNNLLVAGAVDSGKTEFLYSVIASLVLCYTPDKVSLLLDDVTRVEFTSFNGLPHLIRPAVIYLEESIEALKWLESEVAARYQKLATVDAPDVRAYNEKNITGEPMPFIAVIVYELSDLMMGFKKIAEQIICNLTRTAPGVGIHLVIGTQRPSPDVITDNLKECFPARACFFVNSPVDSLVVLDAEGAEKLREQGEMLFIDSKDSKIRHLQGFYIAYDEIDSLVSNY
ncbi:FtsK/SpoIIIE domain-containing protein [Chloroflexota bacterium]